MSIIFNLLDDRGHLYVEREVGVDLAELVAHKALVQTRILGGGVLRI